MAVDERSEAQGQPVFGIDAAQLSVPNERAVNRQLSLLRQNRRRARSLRSKARVGLIARWCWCRVRYLRRR